MKTKLLDRSLLLKSLNRTPWIDLVKLREPPRIVSLVLFLPIIYISTDVNLKLLNNIFSIFYSDW